MRRRWLRGLAIAAITVVGGVAACFQLLPERYAVNAPLESMLLGGGIDPPTPSFLEGRVKVPNGLAIDVWAEVPRGRALRFTSAGDLLVTQPRSGRILLLHADRDGDGRSDGEQILLEGLERPHGMDILGDWLYIAEGDAVGRIRFDAASRAVQGSVERVVTDLPAGGNHWTRTIRVGPDGLLYVSVGSSCNVCVEEDERRAAMLRFRPDGSKGEVFATGLRNSVGFDWQPETGALYATDNGRDLLGDDFPPCELNRIEAGGFYGWPFASGDRVVDPDFGDGQAARIAESIPPAHSFGAHTAPLGMTFVRGNGLPGYRGAALVALHGSWNRTRKSGYKVVSLHWDASGGIEERDFAAGFEIDEDVIGRPVDVVEGPDGAVYVSDDYAGAIYRIGQPRANAARATAPAAPPAPGASAPEAAADPLAAMPDADRSAHAARGRAVYEAQDCAGCHEPERAAPGVVPVPLSRERLLTRYDLESLEAFFRAPTPPMPVPRVDAGQRRDLAVFLLSGRG